MRRASGKSPTAHGALRAAVRGATQPIRRNQSDATRRNQTQSDTIKRNQRHKQAQSDAIESKIASKSQARSKQVSSKSQSDAIKTQSRTCCVRHDARPVPGEPHTLRGAGPTTKPSGNQAIGQSGNQAIRVPGEPHTLPGPRFETQR
eukprot:7357270-Prymnesium_polylepis.1